MTTPTIYLKLPLSPYSGYGADGIGITRTLIEAGANVMVEAPVVQAPLPRYITDLLTKPVQGPFDVSIVHVDPMSLEATDGLRASSGVLIGWTMWEYSNFENLPNLREPVEESTAWIKEALDYSRMTGKPFEGPSDETISEVHRKAREKAVETFRKSLANFDILVGYDQITADCLRPYFDGPIIVLQGGYDPDMWKPLTDRDWSSKEFRFCQLGVLSSRKNPFATIEAFGRAKSEDAEFNRWARLSLKTTAPGLHSKMEDMFGEWDEEEQRNVERDPDTGEKYQSLRIFYDMWPTEVIKKFYEANHVLVAPSRGEGKNMPALEFLSTGGSVIATAWGGHMMWLSSEYAYGIDYTLEPESPGSESLNASVDIEHLKTLMLHAFHNRAEVRRKGEIASQVIPASHSWPKVMERLFLRVRDELGDKGQQMWGSTSQLVFFLDHD